MILSYFSGFFYCFIFCKLSISIIVPQNQTADMSTTVSQDSKVEYNEYYSYPQMLFESLSSLDETYDDFDSDYSDSSSFSSQSSTTSSTSSYTPPPRRQRSHEVYQSSKAKTQECAECIKNCVECQINRSIIRKKKQSRSLQYALINQLINITKQRTEQSEFNKL